MWTKNKFHQAELLSAYGVPLTLSKVPDSSLDVQYRANTPYATSNHVLRAFGPSNPGLPMPVGGRRVGISRISRLTFLPFFQPHLFCVNETDTWRISPP